MTNLSAPFAPDWVSPPGDSIADILEERSWTQKELAIRLGYTEKFVSQLLNGQVPLSQEVAEKLEKVVGGTCDFWLNREANYQRHKARIEATQRYAEFAGWLKEIPVKALMTAGVVSNLRIEPKNHANIVEQCLMFFGVATPAEWRKHYAGMQVSFRRSKEEQSDVGAISAWLRLGEQKAEKIIAPKFNRAHFERALSSIRELTCEPPEVFEPILRQQLLSAGVLLIFVPSIKGSHVSGVARWLSPTRPVIQMSLYGKTNDKFWFTLFHEAAHILLHSGNAEEKRSIFLDDPNSAKSTSIQEHEANIWASRWLIPEAFEHELPHLRTKAAVRSLAQKIRIHPGIVAGRLQHDKLVDPSWFNDLKESFTLAPQC